MHVITTTPVEVGGQTARSQLVKNTGLKHSGQTNFRKRPIIHTIQFLVGNDTLWTTKVMVSRSAVLDAAKTSSCTGSYRCTKL
jgi:hypothetical protein